MEQRPQLAVEAEAALAPTVTSSPASAPGKPAARRKLPYALLYLLPLASLVYLLLLPQHPLVAQRIYTDENAWAADGAREALSHSHIAHAQHVQRRLMSTEGSQPEEVAANLRDNIARTWREMGLDVHGWRHQHDGGGRWAGETSELLYAVIPSRMGDGKEAVALVVDFNPRHIRSSATDTSMSAVAIVSGLAQYLLGVPWLARDVLLVAVESSGSAQKAVDALGGWLHTYRSPAPHPASASSSLNASNLYSASSSFAFTRSGSIFAALCLDIPLGTPLSSTFTLHVGGVYGLSPNLDIVSVLLQMLQRRGMPVSIADNFPSHSPLSTSSAPTAPEWLKDEHKGLLRSMLHHVTGEATGFHGHFIANNIDAVTLQAVPPAPNSRGQQYHSTAGFTGALLLALDSFCHSLNNLIEKLHHSTWLYLLVTPTHFVTMSKYVYAFALLAAPLPLLALSRLYGSGGKRWMQTGGVAVWLYAIGWFVVGASVLMRGVSGRVGVVARETIVQALVVLTAMSGSALCGASASGWRSSGGVELDWRTLQALVLLTTFFVVSPLAILNFPLSIALLLAIVPAAVHVSPVKRGSRRWSALTYQLTRLSQLAVLLLCSPATLAAAYVLYWRLSVTEAAAALLSGLLHLDHVLYLLLPGVYLPVHLMCWLLWLLPLSAADDASQALVAAATARRDKKLR